MGTSPYTRQKKTQPKSASAESRYKNDLEERFSNDFALQLLHYVCLISLVLRQLTSTMARKHVHGNAESSVVNAPTLRAFKNAPNPPNLSKICPGDCPIRGTLICQEFVKICPSMINTRNIGDENHLRRL